MISLSKCGHCSRALAFEEAGWPRTKPDEATLRRFKLGHEFELSLKERLRSEGWRVLCEQLVVHWGGYTGHIDGIVESSGNMYLLECKSAGTRSFDALSAHGIDEAQHKWYLRTYYSQIQAYLAGIREQGMAIKCAILEVAERDDRKVDPLIGYRRFNSSLGYKPVVAGQIARKLWRIAEWRRNVTERAVPPLSFKDPISTEQCEACDYGQVCRS